MLVQQGERAGYPKVRIQQPILKLGKRSASYRAEINLPGGKVRPKSCILILGILDFESDLFPHPFIQPAVVVVVL